MALDHVKIQINSEKGLKELINSDTEFEIAIKREVIRGIPKAYEEAVLKRVNVDDVATAILARVRERLIDRDGWSTCLKPEYQKLVDDKVKSTVAHEISSAVAEFGSTEAKNINEKLGKIREEYAASLDGIADDVVEKLTSEKVERMIDERVEARLKKIKESLGG